MTHTILGAGGAIAKVLTDELLKSGRKVRLVSRSGHTAAGTESLRADLLSADETKKAVQGSDIVHLLAGLPYDSRIWSEQWPKIMRNSIDACKAAHAKLIFFDNVYAYGLVRGKMTESTPYAPCSRKGEIRVKIAALLEEEYKKKNLDAMIVRSADFYGPYATASSLPFILGIDKLMKGKSAQWPVDLNKPHSFTYTIDCAKALLLLAERDECFNQTWHLPTSNPPIDGRAFITLIARELKVQPRMTVMKKWMVRMAGMINRTVYEIYEMLYQYENEY